MSAPIPYFSTWGVNNNTYNQIIDYMKMICSNHEMKPSCTYGPIWNFNADNNLTFPAIWISPSESNKYLNTIQGVRVKKYQVYVYALDRIDKGDKNYLEIMSDMDFLLSTIIAEIRESEWARLNYFILDSSDTEMKPMVEVTDEYTNGWQAKITFLVPDIYNTCNIPISTIPDCQTTYVANGYVVCGYVE